MNFLVTGITGFVGPHLANLLLSEGHDVCGLVRASNGREHDIRDVVPDEMFNKVRFLYGDITDGPGMARLFQEHAFDGVFHLAAQSHPPTSFKDPEGTFVTNVNGTVNIAGAIARHQTNCRLMFCSTSEVYGNVPEEAGLITEEFPIAPVNPYGVSKAAADLYVRERARSTGVPFFVTRAFSHTGPRRGSPFSISSDALQIAQILRGLKEPIIRVGTLSSRRAVMDVRDCVRAYYRLMLQFKPGEAYNVGGDELFSMGDLLGAMLRLSGLEGRVELQVDPALVRPIDIPVQRPDSQKCRQVTGWKPEIPIETTLRDLLSYWNSKLSQAG